MNVLVEKEAGACGAALAGVGEDGEERAIDRFIDDRVGKDDVRALATELERDLLDRARRISMMRRPLPVSPVKATLSTSGWPQSASPISLPGPVSTLTTPSGIPASRQISPSMMAVIGVALAGFRMSVLPAARAGQLPGRHQEREVPGHDLGADSHGFAQGIVEQRAVHGDGFAPELAWRRRSTRSSWPRRRHIRASTMILPQLIVSRRESSSTRSRMMSAARRMRLARSRGAMPDQRPSSKARRAAATARSTSSMPHLWNPANRLIIGRETVS